jgi:heat-inducible transcriptional repressor
LELVEGRAELVAHLDRTPPLREVSVTIGPEHRAARWNECTLVTASYGFGDNVLGAIGVLGPIRMDYRRVIPIVAHTARVLTQVITDQ